MSTLYLLIAAVVVGFAVGFSEPAPKPVVHHEPHSVDVSQEDT